jgi:hypothetical protein
MTNDNSVGRPFSFFGKHMFLHAYAFYLPFALTLFFV